MRKITVIFICLFFLESCAGVREGFTLKKKSSVDEFLVEKKSPLVLPPNYGKLPVPQDQEINSDTKFPENDHRNYNINRKAFDVGDTFSGVDFEKGIEAVAQLKKLLPKNISLSELALKWILSHDEVSVVIPGAVNKSQVQINANASEIENISYLLPKINSIYDELIKSDVHNRW